MTGTIRPCPPSSSSASPSRCTSTPVPTHPYASPSRPITRSRSAASLHPPPMIDLPPYPQTIAINHRLIFSAFPAESSETGKQTLSPVLPTSPFARTSKITTTMGIDRVTAVLDTTQPFQDGPLVSRTTYKHPEPSTSRSLPHSRSSRTQIVPEGEDQLMEVYTFSLDGHSDAVLGQTVAGGSTDGKVKGAADWLKYTPFCRDFGPFNLAQVWKFRQFVNGFFQSPQFAGHPLCLVCPPDDPEMKANAICMISLYAMMEWQKHPSVIMAMLEHVEIKSFRDASDMKSVWGLSIQDILYGMKKGVHLKWINMNTFDKYDYEKYEQVHNGDLNTLGPFIAFATPRDEHFLVRRGVRSASHSRHAPPCSSGSPEVDSLMSSTSSSGAGSSRLSTKFVKVLNKFVDEGVKLVIRLNDELYDKREFELRGMEHLDMEFEDGSNPSLELTRKFIKKVDKLIDAGGKVAVHCKAGLGRTGALIGAYMIYKHNFSAGQAIGLMRIIRPGMVVGPQQVWLVESASEFTRWAGADEYARSAAKISEPRSIDTPVKTPRSVTSVSSLRNFFSSTKPGETVCVADTPRALPKSPGQPRKTPGGHCIETLITSPSKRRMPLIMPGTPTPVKASKVHHPYNLVPTPRKAKSERVDAGSQIPPVPSVPKQYRRTDREASISATPSRIPAPSKTPAKLSGGHARTALTPSKSLSAMAGDVFGFFNATPKKDCSATETSSSPLR